MQPASTLSTSRPSRRILLAVLLVAGLLSCSPVLAQNSSPKPSRPKRSLVLEVLIQPSPIYRVRAQEWGRELQELGYA
ncbi:MAG: hypothetical protein ACK5MO_25245, partial [Planctomyces sp.]